MPKQKSTKNINAEIKEIKKRLDSLEKALAKGAKHPHKVKTEKNTNKNESVVRSKTKSDGKPKNSKNNEALVNENLEIHLISGGRVEVDEKDIVSNELVMGDNILIDFKNGKIDKFKVARRAKKEIVEGLVTQKGDVLYAVTKHGVHRLINYDVKTKGVYKGFEVNVILPKDKESSAKTVVIKDIESTGDFQVENDTNIKKAPKHNPKILEDDDLV